MSFPVPGRISSQRAFAQAASLFSPKQAHLGTLKYRTRGWLCSLIRPIPSSAFCSSSSMLLCPPARKTSPMHRSAASRLSRPSVTRRAHPVPASCGGRRIRNFPPAAFPSPSASSVPPPSRSSQRTRAPSSASPKIRSSFRRHSTAPSANRGDNFSISFSLRSVSRFLFPFPGRSLFCRISYHRAPAPVHAGKKGPSGSKGPVRFHSAEVFSAFPERPGCAQSAPGAALRSPRSAGHPPAYGTHSR